MMTGKVKFFDADRGFGFIVRDDEGPDVFVHITAIQSSGLRALAPEQVVSFELMEDSRTGKSKAVNLRPL
jgi:CspA family cold shock protein